MNKTKQAIETRGKALVTILLIIFGIGIVYPVLSRACSSLSSKKVIKTMPASLVPIEGKKVEINGQECDLFNIEIDGKEMELAHTGKHVGGAMLGCHLQLSAYVVTHKLSEE